MTGTSADFDIALLWLTPILPRRQPNPPIHHTHHQLNSYLVLGRFRFPEVDELVMVQVKQIQEMGAYVKLVSSTPPTP